MSESESGSAARQNRAMPKRRPIPDLPAQLAALFEVFQNPTRVLAIRYVLAHPRATTQQVAAAIDAPSAPVYRALAALEQAGYLHADGTPGVRTGRTVHYTADRARLSADAGALFGWLVG